MCDYFAQNVLWSYWQIFEQRVDPYLCRTFAAAFWLYVYAWPTNLLVADCEGKLCCYLHVHTCTGGERRFSEEAGGAPFVRFWGVNFELYTLFYLMSTVTMCINPGPSCVSNWEIAWLCVQGLHVEKACNLANQNAGLHFVMWFQS